MLLIWVTGGLGIIFMLVYKFTNREAYGVLGQSLIICGFGLVSLKAVNNGKILLAIVFGLSAAIQAVALVQARTRYRKLS
jgi:hypothetical protein